MVYKEEAAAHSHLIIKHLMILIFFRVTYILQSCLEHLLDSRWQRSLPVRKLVLDHLWDVAAKIHLRDVDYKSLLLVNLLENVPSNMADSPSHFIDFGYLVIACLVCNVAYIFTFFLSGHIDQIAVLNGPDPCISHVIDSSRLAFNLDGMEHFDLFELRVDALKVFLDG